MYLSVSKVYGSFNSELAKSEKNDCVVRSVASAASVSYNAAHKLYGELIKRKKTLKSFIASHKVGTYLVMIANHALTVKDGEVFDWSTNAFKPTTKVVAAYELIEKENSGQMSLFD